MQALLQHEEVQPPIYQQKIVERQFSDEELEALIKELTCRNEKVREVAEQKLASLNPKDLMWMVSHERKKTRKTKTVLIVTILSLCAANATYTLAFKPTINFGSVIFSTMSQLLVGFAAISHVRKSSVKALAATDSKEAIGNLIESLEIVDQEVNEAIDTALIRLLPRITASDVEQFTLEQRRLLRGRVMDLFRSGNNNPHLVQVCVAIIKAWEQIGDKEELQLVQKILAKKWSEDEMSVHEGAQACLPYLKVRVENLEESRTLLRGSSPSVDSPDVLLRPAMGSEQTPPDELLRPHIATNPPTFGQVQN